MKLFFRIIIAGVFLLGVALAAVPKEKNGYSIKSENQIAGQNQLSTARAESSPASMYMESKEETAVNEKLREYDLDITSCCSQLPHEKPSFIVQIYNKQNFKKVFVPIYLRGQAFLC